MLEDRLDKEFNAAFETTKLPERALRRRASNSRLDGKIPEESSSFLCCHSWIQMSNHDCAVGVTGDGLHELAG